MVAAQSMVVVPHMYKNLQYNPLTDFAPISMVAYGTLILVTYPASGVHGIADLKAVAKERNNPLTYSSPGFGLPQHLAMKLIKEVANLQLLHVPYKGSAGALSDLIGGHVALSLVPLQIAAPQVRSGKLRALASSQY